MNIDDKNIAIIKKTEYDDYKKVYPWIKIMGESETLYIVDFGHIFKIEIDQDLV